MKYFYATCCGLLTICICACLFETILLQREARIKIDSIAADIDAIKYSTQRMEGNISGVAYNGSAVLAQELRAFNSQQAYFDGLSRRTNKILGDADDTIVAFNRGVLPRLSASLDSADGDLLRLGVSIGALSDSSAQTFAAISANVEAAKPAIENANAVMANAAAISESGRRVAEHYERAILAPVNKAKQAALFAASIAGRLLRIF